jgi:hypothetical protein
MGRTQLGQLLRATARVLVRAIPVILAIADALTTRPPKQKPPQ